MSSWSSEISSDDTSLDAESMLRYGLTIGLSDTIALQFYDNSSESKFSGGAGYTEIDSQELNLLFSSAYEPNTAYFIGMTSYKTTIGYTYEPGKGKTKTGVHIGAIGVYEMTENTSLYAIGSVGTDILSCEFGLGHYFTDNLEFNVYYRLSDYFKPEIEGDTYSDLYASGIGAGLSYSF